MTKREWQDFRNRVKKLNPRWYKCSCPKGCKADSLDERWHYDYKNHIKRFAKAEFICRGCHWLKTPSWRIQTWLDIEAGRLLPPKKPPHIIRCLGWTEAQVERLRKKDLEEYQCETEAQEEILREYSKGRVEIRFWKVDLTAMKRYGYSEDEIAVYEERMNSRIINLDNAFKKTVVTRKLST